MPSGTQGIGNYSCTVPLSDTTRVMYAGQLNRVHIKRFSNELCTGGKKVEYLKFLWFC